MSLVFYGMLTPRIIICVLAGEMLEWIFQVVSGFLEGFITRLGGWTRRRAVDVEEGAFSVVCSRRPSGKQRQAGCPVVWSGKE